jgi:AcrR family transcriptional regulator
MVVGAAELMSRRGVAATSMRDVVRHSETPRGSIGHHFPGGKQQLIEEAIDFAGASVSRPLQTGMSARGAIAGLRDFIALWRRILRKSDFKAGCPVLAAAIDPYAGEESEPPNRAEEQARLRLLDRAHAAFADWQHVITGSLQQEGLSPDRARRLAALVVASVEGTIAMCRAARDTQPLDDVAKELELILTRELPR